MFSDRFRLTCLAVAIPLMLAGCGGGSSSSSDDGTDPVDPTDPTDPAEPTDPTPPPGDRQLFVEPIWETLARVLSFTSDSAKIDGAGLFVDKDAFGNTTRFSDIAYAHFDDNEWAQLVFGGNENLPQYAIDQSGGLVAFTDYAGNEVVVGYYEPRQVTATEGIFISQRTLQDLLEDYQLVNEATVGFDRERLDSLSTELDAYDVPDGVMWSSFNIYALMLCDVVADARNTLGAPADLLTAGCDSDLLGQFESAASPDALSVTPVTQASADALADAATSSACGLRDYVACFDGMSATLQGSE